MAKIELSVTVTSCVAVAVLLLASVAVQVTVVLPTGNLAGASLVMDTGLNASVAVAVPMLMATA